MAASLVVAVFGTMLAVKLGAGKIANDPPTLEEIERAGASAARAKIRVESAETPGEAAMRMEEYREAKERRDALIDWAVRQGIDREEAERWADFGRDAVVIMR